MLDQDDHDSPTAPATNTGANTASAPPKPIPAGSFHVRAAIGMPHSPR